MTQLHISSAIELGPVVTYKKAIQGILGLLEAKTMA
jgi:hypothetical protein